MYLLNIYIYISRSLSPHFPSESAPTLSSPSAWGGVWCNWWTFPTCQIKWRDPPRSMLVSPKSLASKGTKRNRYNPTWLRSTSFSSCLNRRTFDDSSNRTENPFHVQQKRPLRPPFGPLDRWDMSPNQKRPIAPFVAMPFVPSSVLVPSSKARSY